MAFREPYMKKRLPTKKVGLWILEVIKVVFLLLFIILIKWVVDGENLLKFKFTRYDGFVNWNTNKNKLKFKMDMKILTCNLVTSCLEVWAFSQDIPKSFEYKSLLSSYLVSYSNVYRSIHLAEAIILSTNLSLFGQKLHIVGWLDNLSTNLPMFGRRFHRICWKKHNVAIALSLNTFLLDRYH